MNNLLLIGTVAIIAVVSLLNRRRQSRLPPGPKGLPIVGNVFDIPKEGVEWRKYVDWSQQFGSDLIYLKLFTTPVIVINSYKAATDLLEKRSNIYSDRGPMTMLGMVGWKRAFGFIPYGENWREHRRAFHQHYNSNAVKLYRSNAVMEAKKLVHRFMETPENYNAHIRTMTGALILGVTFGIQVDSMEDPNISLAEEAMHSLAMVGNVGSYMVDYLPWLQYIPSWLPGAQFKRDAQKWAVTLAKMFDEPLEYVREKMKTGNVVPSVAATLLTGLDEAKDKDREMEIINHITGSAYTAGADTTVSSLLTFVLAMMMNPEVQKKGQEEIDRVIGNDRLPEYEDMDDLPYVTAVLKETLRWQPVTPLAIPHMLNTDDEYNGYHLPAGALVVGNTWAVLHDPARYPNPEAFDPSRFLTPDGQLDESVPDPMEAAFGFGRRICPGRHFAVQSMWISIAYTLATLQVNKKLDQSGKPIEPCLKYTAGLVSYPTPYEVDIKPRSRAANDLIQAAVLDL